MSNSPNAIKLTDALAALPGPGGERFALLFQRHDVDVEFYAPRGTDPQTPHTRDEFYIVAAGAGTFVCADDRQKFATGDFLFAPAGVAHRFEDFTEDFATWVIFFGPEQPKT